MHQYNIIYDPSTNTPINLFSSAGVQILRQYALTLLEKTGQFGGSGIPSLRNRAQTDSSMRKVHLSILKRAIPETFGEKTFGEYHENLPLELELSDLPDATKSDIRVKYKNYTDALYATDANKDFAAVIKQIKQFKMVLFFLAVEELKKKNLEISDETLKSLLIMTKEEFRKKYGRSLEHVENFRKKLNNLNSDASKEIDKFFSIYKNLHGDYSGEEHTQLGVVMGFTTHGRDISEEALNAVMGSEEQNGAISEKALSKETVELFVKFKELSQNFKQ